MLGNVALQQGEMAHLELNSLLGTVSQLQQKHGRRTQS